MRTISLTLGAMLLAAAAAAQPASQRVHGTISAVTGATITIHPDSGQDITLPLAVDVRISSDKKLAVADIKAGDYVGAEATKQADGTLVAAWVTVFPAAARGAGEGQRQGSSGPDSSMTNANVDEVVVANTGNTLKLSYNDGTADVIVTPDTPIITPVPGDRSLLVPGKHVSAFVRTATDGSQVAAALTVEKDGVIPH
jgi:hypothetical protein